MSRLIDRYGYELRDKALPPRGFATFLDIYRRRSGSPDMVFDIGVGPGTPWLYDAFPDARLTLVEPLAEFAQNIRAIEQRYRATWYACAVGESDGDVELLVPDAVKTGASLLARDRDWAKSAAARQDSRVSPRRVPIRTLDGIAEEAGHPQVIKIDVEGAELAVLRGGAATLRNVDLIIVEASLVQRYENESDLIDIGAYLKQHDFRLADIVEIETYGTDKLIAYVDAAFVRSRSRFWHSAD